MAAMLKEQSKDGEMWRQLIDKEESHGRKSSSSAMSVYADGYQELKHELAGRERSYGPAARQGRGLLPRELHAAHFLRWSLIYNTPAFP